jgi:hypothetical protein
VPHVIFPGDISFIVSIRNIVLVISLCILGVTIARKMLPICICRMYVWFIVLHIVLHQLSRTILHLVLQKVHYKVWTRRSRVYKRATWVNCKLKIVQAAIIIFLTYVQDLCNIWVLLNQHLNFRLAQWLISIHQNHPTFHHVNSP